MLLALKSDLKQKDSDVEELVRKNQKLEREMAQLEGAKRGKRTALERISYCLRPIHYQFPPFSVCWAHLSLAFFPRLLLYIPSLCSVCTHSVSPTLISAHPVCVCSI